MAKEKAIKLAEKRKAAEATDANRRQKVVERLYKQQTKMQSILETIMKEFDGVQGIEFSRAVGGFEGHRFTLHNEQQGVVFLTAWVQVTEPNSSLPDGSIFYILDTGDYLGTLIRLKKSDPFYLDEKIAEIMSLHL